MDSKTKALYNLAVEVKLHCKALECVNNMGEICNLKGVAIDSTGACVGMVKLKPEENTEEKKDN